MKNKKPAKKQNSKTLKSKPSRAQSLAEAKAQQTRGTPPIPRKALPTEAPAVQKEAPVSPLISEIARLSDHLISPRMRTFFDKHHIERLSDVQRMGGLGSRATDARPADQKMLQTLDAHQRLYVLTQDPLTSTRLFDQGYRSVIDVAEAPRSAIVEALGDHLGDIAAASLHARAHAIAAVMENTLADYATQDPDAKDGSILPERCGCRDCEAAMSPLAYLADLMDYTLKHTRLNGKLNSIDDLEDFFFQPFGSLPLDCADLNQQVRQVRLCIEILRRYLQTTLPTPGQAAALATAEQAYRAATYLGLLQQLGVSYDEIRSARVAPAEARQALADRLGIELAPTRPDFLDTLFLDPEAPAGDPLALTEAGIEELFGLVDTARDPFLPGPVPKLLTAWLAHLHKLWLGQDRPSDPNSPSLPVLIDPDIIGPADFKNPTVADPAFKLWQTRETWMDTQRAALAAEPQTAAGLETIVQTSVGKSLSDLAALVTQDEDGLDIRPALAALHLPKAGLLVVTHLNKLLTTAAPVLHSEWETVYDVLVQVQKEAQYPLWRTEEQTAAISLTPETFQIPETTPDKPAVPLKPWRATLQQRQAWQDVLDARIEQEDAARNDLDDAVATTEAANLAALRDALVLASDAEGASFELQNRWLTKRLLVDTRMGTCQMTTRIALAIDTLQNLLFSLSIGQFHPYGQWEPIGDIEWNVFPLLSEVTVISRKPTLIDIFVVGLNGGIYTSSWDKGVDQPHWTPWMPIGNPATFNVPKNSLVSAVARDADHIDLFVVTAGNHIYTASWDGTDPYKSWSAWTAVGSLSVTPLSPVTAIARDAMHIDLFIVGLSGSVHTATLDFSGGVAPAPTWVPVAATLTFKLDQLTRVAAVARDADHLQLFATTPGGEVVSSSWDTTTLAWTSWAVIGSPSVKLAGRKAIAAISRDAQHIDLYAVALNGNVFTTSWDGTEATPAWEPWTSMGHPPPAVLTANMNVTAFVIDAEHVGLALMGTNKGIYALDGDYSSVVPVWGDWRSVGDPAVHQTDPASMITAAVRGSHHVDLFVLGTNGAVYTAPWNLEFWGLVADQFEEEWKWMGSYATWRAAMFIFLYPENVLMSSLHQPQTSAFAGTIRNLRRTARLKPSDICAQGKAYSDYFQDVCTMAIQATCESQTRIHRDRVQGCEDPATPVYRSIFYLFGRGGHTGTAYWSVYDPTNGSDIRQSFWEPIPNIGSCWQIVGAVPYGSVGYPHHIYLFVKHAVSGHVSLDYYRYDLENQRWLTDVGHLDMPNNAVDYGIVVKQTPVERDPPHLFIQVGADIFERMLKVDGSGWADGPWVPMSKYPSSTADPLWGPPPAFRGFGFIYTAVAEGGSANSFYMLFRDRENQLWVVYCNGGYIGSKPDQTIPKSMLWHNFGAVGYQGAVFHVSALDIVVTTDGPRYLVREQNWKTITVKPAGTAEPGIQGFAPLNGEEPNAWKSKTRRLAFQRPEGSYRCMFIDQGPNVGQIFDAPIAPQVKGPFHVSNGLTTTDLQQRAAEIKVAVKANVGATIDPSITICVQEAFYLLPMHFAQQLQEQGQFEEALSWYRVVYDYTQPEGSRIIYYGLEMEKTLAADFKRDADWLLDPLNPHRIAATRAMTYTRFTLISLVRCFIEFAKSEFARDTGESLERTRTLALTALEFLDSEALSQKKGNCDAMIGELEIEVSPVWAYVASGFINTVKKVQDPKILTQMIPQLNALMSAENTSWSERFDRAKTIVAAARESKEPRTLPRVLERRVEQNKEVMLRLLNRQPALAGALQTAADRFVEPLLPTLGGTMAGPGNEERFGQGWLRKPVYVNDPHMVPIGGYLSPDPVDLPGAKPIGPIIPYLPRPMYFEFCVPPNPLLKALRLSAEGILYKLRTCRNAAGMIRQVDPYAAPTDTSSLMPSIVGGQLVLPGTSQLRPTPYRYGILIERAKQLVQLASQIEGSMLAALEKKDAESYSMLKAQQDVELTQAHVRLADLQVNEAQAGVVLAQDQRDRAQLQVEQYQDWLIQGVSQLESSAMQALADGVTLSHMAADLQIAAAAAQTAGGTVTMISTLGLRGEDEIGTGMSSMASSFASRASAKQMASSQEAMQASFERRQAEWQYNKHLAQQDAKIGSQQILVALAHMQVATQERAISALESDQAKTVVDFLSNKFTNADLYDWMSGVLQGVYSYFLQQATATAQLAVYQLAFERQEIPPPFIRADYWQSVDDGGSSATPTNQPTDRRGLTGSARLLQDIYQLDQYAFTTAKRKLQLTKTLSLAQIAPIEFARFRETGVLNFLTPLSLFDRDFPGHYLRLIRKVRTSVIALVPPSQGVHATLACTGISRAVIKGDSFNSTIVRRDPEEIALTSPMNATGVFDMDPQPELLLPFEGLGLETQWQFTMPKAANFIEYSAIADVLLTYEYTAMSDFDYRRQLLQTLPTHFTAERPFAFRTYLADQWYDLNNPDQTATPLTVTWRTTRADFPPNLDDLRIAQVALFFSRADGVTTEITVKHLRFTPAGQTVPIGGGTQTVQGILSTRKANGSPLVPLIGQIPIGTWELALPNTPAMRKMFTDEEIEDILVVVTYKGRTAAWPDA